VNKFKIVAPKGYERKIDTGILSLEYMEVVENKKIYVLICKTITLKPLYVGQLCDKSKMRRVPEKAAKHQLKTA
jgi:hypothetical protein